MKRLLIILFCMIKVAGFAQAPDTSACNQITKAYDEFEKQTTFRTPLLRSCSLTKVITESKERYYFSLDTKGSTLNVGEKGVKIILSNDQVLTFPDTEIDVEAASGAGYTYTAFIPIDQATLTLLKQYSVLKWKLYIYNGDQSKELAAEFLEAANCIAKAK